MIPEGNINNPINRNGLTENTEKIFDSVSKLECIKGLYLCGGTAQSIQMGHRKSEDLDFELIGTTREKRNLNFNRIITELRTKFPNPKIEILGDEHFVAYVNNVKLSFFSPRNPVPEINTGIRYNNILTPSLQDLLGMKVFTTGVRSEIRDYYDIYCLLENGQSLNDAIRYAGEFSNHFQHTKDICARLLTPSLFQMTEEFLALKPSIKITPQRIRDRIEKAIIEENIKKRNQVSEDRREARE